MCRVLTLTCISRLYQNEHLTVHFLHCIDTEIDSQGRASCLMRQNEIMKRRAILCSITFPSAVSSHKQRNLIFAALRAPTAIKQWARNWQCNVKSRKCIWDFWKHLFHVVSWTPYPHVQYPCLFESDEVKLWCQVKENVTFKWKWFASSHSSFPSHVPHISQSPNTVVRCPDENQEVKDRSKKRNHEWTGGPWP